MNSQIEQQNDWSDEIAPLPKRDSLAKEAADRLRELILLEKIGAGAAIPERELSDALGISRTPMREALRLLEIEGLVEFTATRRVRVADPSLDELEQHLTVLGALEGLCGELACIHATDAEIARINDLNETMLAGSNTMEPLDFFRTDMAFHRTIVEASRNAPLMETHRQYNARLWRARFISSRRRPDRAGTLSQHSDIAAAITRRDPAASAAALRGHLRSTIVNIGKSWSERHSLAGPAEP
ncbi:GntR family transcriptional regulator [Shinella sp. NM-101]|uniref:GntR family transcriptional regulator n=1 Tax=Shinella sp. NM-101 TaxID=2744455 RepID=UPI001F42CAE7|nr:GntR family transcriptional regulator [Shinella sp. NM-101]